MSNVKWLTAYKADEDTLVDIKDAPSAKWYRCPNCGQLMYATHGKSSGKTQEDHFRHDEGKECNHETYLHKVAIDRFVTLFEHCVEAHIPLVVKALQSKKCESLPCSLIGSDCPKRYTFIDLTKTFNKASKERRVCDDQYRTDVLLESDKGVQLWVEIWVKHKTEKEKIEAANGEVLEIRIKTDEDTRLITDNRLAEGQLGIEYFGSSLSPVIVCDTPVLSEKGVDQPASEIDLTEEIGTHSPIKQAKPISEIPFDKQSKLPGIDNTPFWKSPQGPRWIDLGLPSGTLWSTELMGVMNYDEAQSNFPGMIPSQEQFVELLTHCTMGEGLGRAVLTGPNGKHLELYEGSFWTTDDTEDTTKKVALHREFVGKPILFLGEAFIQANKQHRLCVRLVK